MHPTLQKVYDKVAQRNQGEALFLQAVEEVLTSLDVVPEARPDLVDLTQAKSQVPHDVIALSDFATVIWDIAEITSTGATGDSTKATQEKGEKMLQCVTDYLVGLVEELERRGWKYDLKK